jgi:hypothetical protein
MERKGLSFNALDQGYLVEGDVCAGLVHQHAVAVELDLVEPAYALGRAVTQGRSARWDEGGTRHGQSVARRL